LPNLACLLPCFSLISIFDSFRKSASSHGMMADDRAPVTRNSPSLRLRGLARGWIVDCYTVPWLNRVDRTSSGTHLRPLRNPTHGSNSQVQRTYQEKKPSHHVRPTSERPFTSSHRAFSSYSPAYRYVVAWLKVAFRARQRGTTAFNSALHPTSHHPFDDPLDLIDFF
jgi:hypothetical protein